MIISLRKKILNHLFFTSCLFLTYSASNISLHALDLNLQQKHDESHKENNDHKKGEDLDHCRKEHHEKKTIREIREIREIAVIKEKEEKKEQQVIRGMRG